MRSVVIVMIMTFTTLFLYIGKQETEMSVVIAFRCCAQLPLAKLQMIGLHEKPRSAGRGPTLRLLTRVLAQDEQIDCGFTTVTESFVTY